MALNAAIVWEVRSTGSDSNGGGFKAGASGTDYSQQDASQFSGTDLVVDGTTNTKVTSAAHNFVATDVGNLIQITAGAGWTTGFYEITSVASNAATLDRSPAAVSTTGGTWAVGGALASLGGIKNATISGNSVWVKQGSYGIGNGTVNTSGNAVALSALITYIEGYQTTRGDLGTRPIFTITTPASWPANQDLLGTQGGRVSNLEIRCASAATSRGIDVSSGHVYRCLVKDAAARGIFGVGDAIIEECVADNSTFLNNGNGGIWLNCVAINAGTFAGVGRAATYINCIAYKSGTAASATAFTNSGGGSTVYRNCIAYNYTTGFSATDGIVENCVAEKCTTGFTAGAATVKTFLRNCAGYNNTTNVNANISNNNGFVSCSSSPFTDAANGDFRLNNTASAGASLRGAGTPSAFQSITSTVSYPDIGAAQHQDSGSSTGIANYGIRSGGRL